MQLSKAGRDFLVKEEGLIPRKYRDHAGYWTLGVGHLLTSKELSTGVVRILGVDVNYNNGITRLQAEELLDQDADYYENLINSTTVGGLAPAFWQYEFDALVSFAFNIGGTAWRKSTARKMLLDGKSRQVPHQMQRWIYSAGKIDRVLVGRRKREGKLFDPTWTP